MPRLADYLDQVEPIIEYFPSAEAFETRTDDFWNALEVNAERVLIDSESINYVRGLLAALGAGGLQALSLWCGIDAAQTRAILLDELASFFASNLELPGCRSVILINEFLFRKRADAIETISRLLLPTTQFNIVNASAIDANSKRFLYTALVFIQNPHQLQLLMLFEKAERAGYQRYVLTPISEIAGEPISEQAAELALQHCQAGADLTQLSIALINMILENFESRHNQQSSLCLDLYVDEVSGMWLVFILRYLRESHIREVEEVVFAQEAELIVFRLNDRMRNIDVHSRSGIGTKIATALASRLLEDPNVQFQEDTTLTHQENLEDFLEILTNAQDERLRFQELYLNTAPIEEAPILILRCTKNQDLSRPLAFLNQRNVDLLQHLANVRNFNIAFVVEPNTEREKSYIFKVYCNRAGPGRYFLPYSVANISTNIRSEFERYLWETYRVRTVPGTG